MKKLFFTMAALVAVMLVSCEREKQSFDYPSVGENGLAFFIDGGASTRSMSTEDMDNIERGVTIPLGTDESGNSFYLEETIEDLNGVSPATKGTPAYTKNVGKLFDMGVVGYKGTTVQFPDATFEVMDQTMYGDTSWRYQHNYEGNLWPDTSTKVDFYLRMPATMSGVTNLSYADKKITFNYTSPYTAEAEQDILFTTRELSQEEHKGFLPQGAPVLFYHALTGVKFRVGNDNSGSTKTIITKVEIQGLKDSGTCVVTPASSESRVVWSNLSTNVGSFSQVFSNPKYAPADSAKNSDGTVTFDNDNELLGNTTFINAKDNTKFNNTQNLNKDDGSWTFWLIPQAMTDDVVLKVYFRVKTPDTPNGSDPDGEDLVHEINFGEQLSGVKWEAGQLRTYTLKPNEIDVAIFDEMSTDTGLKKSNLHVANTGNVDEYVRILVIGNWYGWLTKADSTAYANGDKTKEPSILVGYKTDGSDKYTDAQNSEMVTPWFRGDDLYGQYFDDTFTKGNAANGNKWIKAHGGYYYPDKIGPGTTLNPGTEAIFKYYDLPADLIPTIYVPSNTSNLRTPAVGVHLVMEIAVQAIGVPMKPGTTTEMTWQEAWTNAGIDFSK